MNADGTRYPLWELLAPHSRYGAPDRTAVRARGTRVLYGDGQWRLCANSGLWNVNLGYGNERVAEAVGAALRDASFLSLFRGGHQPAIDASRALLGICGPEHYGRVIFSTSGSAANDLMMKLATQYWKLKRSPMRRIMVGLKGSYHGLTYGSHALTGSPLGQNYYGIDQRFVRHVSHQDPDELAALLAEEGDTIAAVIVEPVLGTGAFPLPQTMLTALDDLRRQHGYLLVADEVATGFGRTGPYFASSDWPLRPDILIASKGLTNGTCAAAAVVVCHQLCEPFERLDAVLVHGETQAGTPPTCAAITAVIEEMAQLDALDLSKSVSNRLDGLLAGLTDHPLVIGHDGAGCFRAIRLEHAGSPLDALAVATILDAVRSAGAVVQAGPSCIQVSPAFVYGDEDMALLGNALRIGLDIAAETLAG